MTIKYDRDYATATTLYFPLYDVAGASLQTGAAHVAGDTVIMINGGAPVNTTNAFVDEGTTYSLALTIAEITGKTIVITVVDQTAPPVWLDEVLIIETVGETANAQHDVSC